MLLLQVVDNFATIRLCRDVCAQRLALSRALSRKRGRESLRVFPTGDDDARTVLHEGARYHRSNATAAAGDQYDLAGDIEDFRPEIRFQRDVVLAFRGLGHRYAQALGPR